MKIGIGLPNNVVGARGPQLVDWAQRAEQRGFESVTTIDRLVYPSLDSIIALALAAGATTDLALVSNILIAPLYPAAVLAKQLATLALATGDRIAIGVAVGARDDDYLAAGVDFDRRGRVLDDGVEVMRKEWCATAISPAPVRIPLVFGGRGAATLRRATTIGDGWAGGALRDYRWQSAFADRVRTEWHNADRSGQPLLHMSVNFAIGDQRVADAGRLHLAQYYGFKPEFAQLNIDDMITTPQDARDTVRAYRDLGFDRLLFHPTVASLDQVDRLADAVL